MNNLFVKTRSTKDIIISTVLLVAGVTMVALPTPASVNIAGLFMACTGIVLLAVLKSSWKNTETREKFSSKTLYFPREMDLIHNDMAAPRSYKKQQRGCKHQQYSSNPFHPRKDRNKDSLKR